MKILATPYFFRRIHELLTSAEYGDLEDHVIANPMSGALIPGGKGLRKLRWKVKSKATGTRGGVRVIYYYRVGAVLYFVTVYEKNECEDLSAKELKALVHLIQEEKP